MNALPSDAMQRRVLVALDSINGKSSLRICLALGVDPVYAPTAMVEAVRLALFELSGALLVYQERQGAVVEWRLTSLGVEKQRELRHLVAQ